MSKIEVSISLSASCNSILIAVINRAGLPVLMEQIDNPDAKNSITNYSRTFYYQNPGELQLFVMDGSNGGLLAQSGSSQLLTTTLPGSPGYVLSADVTDCKSTDTSKSVITERLRNMYLENGIVNPPDVIETTTSNTWMWLLFVILILLVGLLIWWVVKYRKPGTELVNAPVPAKAFH